MDTIKSLKEVEFNEIFEAFSEAFKDYEIQINKQEFKTMINRRGFDPQLSFGIFNENRLVSLTCNGVGTFNGIKTAYDTGTGTIKEFRGKDYATEVFNYSIPYLKEAGITQYLLEVLQHNEKAVSIYKKIGFEVTREFNYYVTKQDKLNFCSKIKDTGFCINEINVADIEHWNDFMDFVPSWQNSFEAINRKLDDFVGLGAYKDNKLAGYCILEPNSGDITQIAVKQQYRRMGIATTLLKEILKHNKHENVKIVNTDTNCNSITQFIESISIPLSGKQFEMIKEI